MKKILIICILIIGIVFISGCTSDDKTNSESFSSNSQQSNIQETKLILNRGDVPGFTLQNYYFKYHPKVTEYYLGDGIPRTYSDVLPEGQRNVGQYMEWTSGETQEEIEFVVIDINKYDSNSGFEDPFKNIKNAIQSGRSSYESANIEIEEGNLNIGDDSYYVTFNSPDAQSIAIAFIHDTTYVMVSVSGDKNTGIRIAKIIESRLD